MAQTDITTGKHKNYEIKWQTVINGSMGDVEHYDNLIGNIIR